VSTITSRSEAQGQMDGKSRQTPHANAICVAESPPDTSVHGVGGTYALLIMAACSALSAPSSLLVNDTILQRRLWRIE
jgi:hypothetical protein